MEQKKERLLYLDGMKALALFFVFNTHFLNAFYSGIYTLNPKDFKTSSGVEWIIGATPLNLVYAGKLGARIFLGISAFLVVWNYFNSYKISSPFQFVKSVCKRYLRLLPAIAVVNVLVWAGMMLGLYQNKEAAQLIGTQEFYGVYNQFSPSVVDALKEAIYGCFILGSNDYNGPLWFIQYEFLGCMLLGLILMVFGKYKLRYLCYGIGIVVFIRSDYLVMILCALAADVMVHYEDLIEGILATSLIPVLRVSVRSLLWLLVIPAFYFATFPSYGTNLENSIYAFLPAKVLFYYNIVIPCILVLIAYLKPLRKVMEWKGFAKLNRISYCFYLIHFPVLCMFSSWFYLNGYQNVNYHILTLLNYVATISIVMILSFFLTKVIDQPAVRLAGFVTGR